MKSRLSSSSLWFAIAAGLGATRNKWARRAALRGLGSMAIANAAAKLIATGIDRTPPGLAIPPPPGRQNGIQLAVSNPCFELWLILHFQDHSAWLDNDGARMLRRKLDGPLPGAAPPSPGREPRTLRPAQGHGWTRHKQMA